MPESTDTPAPIGKLHARRLREVYRSAGWPCQDTVEIVHVADRLPRHLNAQCRQPLADPRCVGIDRVSEE